MWVRTRCSKAAGSPARTLLPSLFVWRGNPGFALGGGLFHPDFPVAGTRIVPHQRMIISGLRQARQRGQDGELSDLRRERLHRGSDCPAAVERGHRPILAGRNATEITSLASALGLAGRPFPLEPAVLDRNLEGVTAVLHCAGPFAHTARVMAQACIRQGVHYLDVTGEIPVFEMLAATDEAAKQARVMLLPGVGFDVVPTDCLAAHLHQRLPKATRLRLGFQIKGRLSRGTANTMIENLDRGGAVRKQGKIRPVRACWKTRAINLAMARPWR